LNELLEHVMTNLNEVDWSQLPQPEDDGAVSHLTGAKLKKVGLPATDGMEVDLSTLTGTTVIYIYPMTGRPDTPLPDGWDGIPGARGCTPQSCAFRDHYADLKAVGVDHLYGLSKQTTDYQAEAADRMHLPFALLSDADHAFGKAMNLPMFEADGMKLLKRLTMIVRDGTVIQTFYPVFPPDRNADDVIDWLKSDKA
jgi:peroxiredoxin